MNAKLIELAERRTILVARAATQRAELSQALAPWREALAVAHRGWVAMRYIRSHGSLLMGVAAFVAPFGPWRAAKWLRRGWLVWNMARLMKRILPIFSAAFPGCRPLSTPDGETQLPRIVAIGFNLAGRRLYHFFFPGDRRPPPSNQQSPPPLGRM